MSVIVKGMKMPDSCYHCKIAESCGHYIANYSNRRHPDCPLVALPDHHGRLVDADELHFSSMLDRIDQGIAEETVMDAQTIVEAEGEE